MKPGYKQTKVGVIPEDWDTTTIAEIAAIKTGPFGTLLKASEYTKGEGVPLISVGEVREGYLRINEETPRVCSMVTRRLPQYVLEEGDIVFGRKGGVDRSALIKSDQKGWFLGSDGLAIRPKGKVSNAFLGAQFQTSRVKDWLLQNAIGTTMPSLNQGILGGVAICLPPTLAEQEAIAGALSDADALIDSLEQLIAKKRLLKQGVMQDLLTGKKRLPGFAPSTTSLSSTPFGLLPADWVPTRLDSVSTLITKGSTPTTFGFAWVSAGMLFLRSECVSDRGLDLSQSMFISDAAHQAFRKSEVAAGDLLMTITGNVGRVVLLGERFGTANINQHIAKIRIIREDVSKNFIFHFLSQRMVRERYELITTGQAYPQISLTQVRETEIPLPSLPEQTAIAAILSDMDAEIAALEAKLAKARQIKQGMMQELLTGKTRLVRSDGVLTES